MEETQNLNGLDDSTNDVDTNADVDTDDIDTDDADTKVDDENKSDDNKDELFGSPEKFDYSDIKLPEGMELDKELLDEFEPIAKKFNLSNKSANELMNLAVKLSTKNISAVQDAIVQAQIAEKNSYIKMLESDKELNANNTSQYNQYVDVAINGLNAVATQGFKDFIKEKGLTHHPEFIKVFHNIGKLCKDADIPEVKNPTSPEKTAAQILYGNKKQTGDDEE